MNLKSALLLLVLAATSAAVADESEKSSPGVLFTPLGTLVDSETSRENSYFRSLSILRENPNGWEMDEFRNLGGLLVAAVAAMRGEVEYTETLIEPTNGETSHRVNCSETDMLVFAFIAGRSKSQMSVANFKIRTEWRLVPKEGKPWKRSNFLNPSDSIGVPDSKVDRRRPVYTEWLELKRKARRDGDLSLTVSYRGEVLHEERYEIVGCD